MSVASEVPAAVDWLSALGALAAVAVALLVVYLEYHRTRRDQASRISAWAADVTEPRLRTETGAS